MQGIVLFISANLGLILSLLLTLLSLGECLEIDAPKALTVSYPKERRQNASTSEGPKAYSDVTGSYLSLISEGARITCLRTGAEGFLY